MTTNAKKTLMTVCGALSVGATAYAAQSERPNIIFILTDDQRYELLGCTGHPIVQTPNIDRLAKEGVLFHNAHVSSPISKPSRTCLLTGRFERNHGVNFNSGTALSAEAWEECYPVVLRKNGYYTGYIGKNHTPVGEKGYKTGVMEQSFDYWYGGHQHLGFYPKERHKIFKDATASTQVEILQEGMLDFLNPNERNLKGAVHFLNSRDESKPFFLNICFNLPHGAGTSTMRQKPTDPELYRTGYRDQIDQIPLPQNYIAKEDIIKQKLPHSVFHPEDRQDGYNYVDTPETLRERNVREMEAVTGIDNLVGELMAELKRQKLDKNTIIIFTADHGIFNGEYGLGGKSLCYEICTKVPFIIYDPRAPKSQRKADNDELVLTIDLSKTILSYGDIKAPESYQGEDLTPMLDGEKSAVREWLFTECLWSTPFGNPRCESVQNKEWKYIRYYKNNNRSALATQEVMKEMSFTFRALYNLTMDMVIEYRKFINAPLQGEKPVYEELYNLKNDPWEAMNLACNNQYDNLLMELRDECDKQLKYARGEGAPRVEITVADYNDLYKQKPKNNKK